MPVTQNQKQERPALKALEVGFIHGAKAGLSSAPLGEEESLTYPTLQGPVPQGEHLPQRVFAVSAKTLGFIAYYYKCCNNHKTNMLLVLA